MVSAGSKDRKDDFEGFAKSYGMVDQEPAPVTPPTLSGEESKLRSLRVPVIAQTPSGPNLTRRERIRKMYRRSPMSPNSRQRR